MSAMAAKLHRKHSRVAVLVETSIGGRGKDIVGYDIKPKTPLLVVKEDWCEEHQEFRIRVEDVVFYHEGNEVAEDATPASLGAAVNMELKLHAVLRAGTHLSFADLPEEDELSEEEEEGRSQTPEGILTATSSHPRPPIAEEKKQEVQTPPAQLIMEKKKKQEAGASPEQPSMEKKKKQEVKTPPAAAQKSVANSGAGAARVEKEKKEDDSASCGDEEPRSSLSQKTDEAKRIVTGSRTDELSAKRKKPEEEDDEEGDVNAEGRERGERRRKQKTRRPLPPGLLDFQNLVLERESANMKKLDDVGSYASFVPGYLAEEEAGLLFEELHASPHFAAGSISMCGKTYPEPRLRFAVGDDLFYSKQHLEGASWQEFPLLDAIRKRVERDFQCFGISSALINLYRNGEDKVDMHQDNHPSFGPEPIIASLSLGATRDFKMKEIEKGGSSCTLPLRNGDLLVMLKKFQEALQHGVPKDKDVQSARINVTFRRIYKKDEENPSKKKQRFLGKLVAKASEEKAIEELKEPAAEELMRLGICQEQSTFICQLASAKRKPDGWSVAKLQQFMVERRASPRKAGVLVLCTLAGCRIVNDEVDKFAKIYGLGRKDAAELQEAVEDTRFSTKEILKSLGSHIDKNWNCYGKFVKHLLETGEPWPPLNPDAAAEEDEDTVRAEVEAAKRAATLAAEKRKVDRKADKKWSATLQRETSEQAEKSIAEEARAVHEKAEKDALEAFRRAEENVVKATAEFNMRRQQIAQLRKD